MSEKIVYAAVAAVMLLCTIADIKKKEISIWLFGVLGLVVIVGGFTVDSIRGYRMAAGIIPGILLVILAKITEQSIGYGDGIILAEIGFITGVGRCTLILAAAMALAAFFSLGVLVIKKVDKRYRIPFVPFMTISYVAVMCMQNNIVSG